MYKQIYVSVGITMQSNYLCLETYAYFTVSMLVPVNLRICQV